MILERSVCFKLGSKLSLRGQTRSDEFVLVEKDEEQVKLLNPSSLNKIGFDPSQLG
jgi:hypothetical protein